MEIAEALDLADDISPNQVLAGYVALAPMGLALPHFGLRRVPNQWYTATCTPAGDPEGHISGFWPVGLPGVVHLPAEKVRDVSVGAPWVDVFLWNNEPYVGTRSELWEMLAPFRDDIAARAPLSGVDLAFGGNAQGIERMTRASRAFIARTYGSSHAVDWHKQALRTRLLSRLEKVGAPSPAAFEMDADGTTLTIMAPGWNELSSEQRTNAVDAATQATSEFGVDLRIEALIAREAEPRLEERRAPPAPGRPDQLKAPDASILELPPAAPQSTLILTAGGRADRIARAIKPLDWAPTWINPSAGELPIIRDKAQRWLEPGMVEVRSIRESPKAAAYDVVVVLIDDRASTDTSLLRQIVQHANSLTSEGGLVILAPALPDDGPSSYLRSDKLEEPDVDLVLDTSVARSPIWGTADRHSLERRIGNLILLTAQACLSGSEINRRLIDPSYRRGHPKFTSLALWSQDDPGDTYMGDTALLSEAGRPSPEHAFIDEMIPLISYRGRSTPFARLVVGHRRSGFKEYAEAVRHSHIRSLVRDSHQLSSYGDVPDQVINTLESPALSAAYRLGEQHVLLTAEAPSVQAIAAGERHGWGVVRLTDFSGLRRVLSHGFGSAAMPTEVKLPALSRFSASHRLAVRGVDPRDIVRVPPGAPAQDLVLGNPSLSIQTRRYFSLEASRTNGETLALPLAELEAMADANPGAAELLRLYRPSARSAKRLGDLNILWSAPQASRYILEDGPLPPRIMTIDGAAVVPAQTFFQLEGDESIPCLFGSALFAVWARITRSRGSGWAQRFATSRTFETFPIVGPFRFATSRAGAQMMFFDRGSSLEAMSQQLRLPAALEAEKRSPDDDSQPVRQEVDATLLQLYGLSARATEVEIAAALLDLNAQLGDPLRERPPVS